MRRAGSRGIPALPAWPHEPGHDGAGRARREEAGSPAELGPSLLVPYLVIGLEPADRLPRLLARFFGAPGFCDLIADVIEIGELAGVARIEPDHVPTVLRLQN